MAERFADRSVVVTGGTGALGRAVVQALLDEGAACHIPALEADPPDIYFEGGGGVTITGGVDLSRDEAVREFYAQAAEDGPIWASLHIAGGFAMGAIDDTSIDDFARMMMTNAASCFLCCREAVGHMKNSGGGRIVNVSAMPGLEPVRGAGMVAYTASKAAVAAITQSLAAEVKGDGIWVNAIAPSIIDTPANRRAMPDADHGSWATPEDLAQTILFLASSENSAATGALVPTGGRT